MTHPSSRVSYHTAGNHSLGPRCEEDPSPSPANLPPQGSGYRHWNREDRLGLILSTQQNQKVQNPGSCRDKKDVGNSFLHFFDYFNFGWEEFANKATESRPSTRIRSLPPYPSRREIFESDSTREEKPFKTPSLPHRCVFIQPAKLDRT